MLHDTFIHAYIRKVSIPTNEPIQNKINPHESTAITYHINTMFYKIGLSLEMYSYTHFKIASDYTVQYKLLKYISRYLHKLAIIKC